MVDKKILSVGEFKKILNKNLDKIIIVDSKDRKVINNNDFVNFLIRILKTNSKGE